MKIIFFTSEIGCEAPGIAYQKILNRLCGISDIICFCQRLDHDVNRRNTYQTHIIPHWAFPPKLTKLLFSILGFNILDFFPFLFFRKRIAKKCKDVDIVISAISSNNCWPLYYGKYLSKMLQCKWAIYSVDAIPAPLGWSKDNMYYRKLGAFIKKYTKSADVFYSSNPIMLDYQLNCLSVNFSGRSGVIFTPYTNVLVNDPKISSPVFLYTGSIYGLRHIDTLLEAFNHFLIDSPKAKLIFVGDIPSTYFNDYLDLLQKGAIIIYSYDKNLVPYYEESTVLIDLSADIPNDVFLSSKIVNYLPLKRPIIAIGGISSVASILFEQDKSIIISTYASDNILEAMRFSITSQYQPNSQRKAYEYSFSEEKVAKDFYKDLCKLVDC